MASAESIDSPLWTSRRALSRLHHGHLPEENKIKIKIINFYLNVFCSQNQKFFTSDNSLVPPESLTNIWNNHYHPIRLLCNGNVINFSSK